MMRQAQQMQAQMAKIQEELAEARSEASAGGGAVKVVVVGGAKVESIIIDPEVETTIQAADHHGNSGDTPYESWKA